MLLDGYKFITAVAVNTSDDIEQCLMTPTVHFCIFDYRDITSRSLCFANCNQFQLIHSATQTCKHAF